MSLASSLRVLVAVVLGGSLSVVVGSGSGCAGKATDGDAVAWDLACPSDEMLMQPSGAPSGLATCDGALTHRVEAVPCEVPDPPAEACESRSGAEGSCSTSADCTERAFGACLDDGVIDPGASQGCRCVYACQTDDDCEGNSKCLCTGGRPQCVAGDCATDADCNGLCMIRSVSGACGGGTTTLVCLDRDDECRPDIVETCAEVPSCVDGGTEHPPCEYTTRGWACGEAECPSSCG